MRTFKQNNIIKQTDNKTKIKHYLDLGFVEVDEQGNIKDTDTNDQTEELKVTVEEQETEIKELKSTVEEQNAKIKELEDELEKTKKSTTKSTTAKGATKAKEE